MLSVCLSNEVCAHPDPQKVKDYRDFIEQFKATIISNFATDQLESLIESVETKLFDGSGTSSGTRMIKRYLIIQRDIEQHLKKMPTKMQEDYLTKRDYMGRYISRTLNNARRDIALLASNSDDIKNDEEDVYNGYADQLNILLSVEYGNFLNIFFRASEEYLSKELLHKLANSEPLDDLYRAYLWDLITNRPILDYDQTTWGISAPNVSVFDIKNSKNKIVVMGIGCCVTLSIMTYYLDIDNLDQPNRLRNYTTLIDIEKQESKRFDLYTGDDDLPYKWDKEKETLLLTTWGKETPETFLLDKNKKKWTKLEETKQKD